LGRVRKLSPISHSIAEVERESERERERERAVLKERRTESSEEPEGVKSNNHGEEEPGRTRSTPSSLQKY